MLHDTVPRSSGILLHPTSLPGPFGIGDLGPPAHEWIAALAEARQSWWQVLPLGPTGYADSPYQALSSFAGNPNLISPTLLHADGLISTGDEAGCFLPQNGGIHFADVAARKRILLKHAWDAFRTGDGFQSLRADFDAFQSAEEFWLADFAQYMALKERFELKPWWEWPEKLAAREKDALVTARTELADEIARHRFTQFLFFRQWSALRTEAHRRGIRIIGDIPIYVAEDSADVWANPSLFLQSADRRPTLVGGVPPDYFSRTGQLWGNPVYDWEQHFRTKYAWWLDRVRAALKLVDVIRLDHFRGIEGFWAVPFGSATAATGSWLPGPGAALLEALHTGIGELPLIAEDLGVITPAVDSLRERFGLPGMRILQFAFGGAVESRFLPHRFERNTVVYTGTHDNDTTAGWAAAMTENERHQLERYAPEAKHDPAAALVRLAWSSVADLAIAPLQDLFGLGTVARMNHPGTMHGNWTWRMNESVLTDPAWKARLAELTLTFERASG
jgi:4-alpha-glucanotransferase